MRYRYAHIVHNIKEHAKNHFSDLVKHLILKLFDYHNSHISSEIRLGSVEMILDFSFYLHVQIGPLHLKSQH